ncbi:hypothetical protein [Gulosibacter molinativorax]|uniref:DUF3263 domain-containing protein n=1 Tax=Gulosibacter molinativorax TaxID=256821 RepID=A0ABT7CBP8_9MICO|nr:hypothetical protein [Gulosibacter molinativorax]MDJ1372061.1 hypothetical protein [Gulosibacter molinativorax]QUY63890.1 Hypotetical protein [Gulosibacter molinativorax]
MSNIDHQGEPRTRSAARPSPAGPTKRRTTQSPAEPRLREPLTKEQSAALARIQSSWNERPRDVPKVERFLARTIVAHRIPLELVSAAINVPYVRVVRIVKRVTGKVPSALAITEARAANHISHQEMIALLSNREYDPPIGGNSGLVDVRQQPNSVTVLQQAYLRGIVTQGELWSIGDSISVRKAPEK